MKHEKKIKEELYQLRQEIEKHDHLYYIEAMPEISDREYDQLISILEKLEQKYPKLIDPNSPTQRVGGSPIDKFNSIKHSLPMQSLSNTYSKDDLIKFNERLKKIINSDNFSYALEPKIDGVAISLRYENGILIYALTRGDGISGDDVTSNIRTIKSIPLKLRTQYPPKILEVRGEIFLNKSGFVELNNNRQHQGMEPFANPRNACAGSLKLLDPKEVSKRPLDAVFYNVGEFSDINIKTHDSLIRILKKYGFVTSPYFRTNNNFNSILNYLDELKDLSENFKFEIDGAVLKVNQRSLYKKLGNTSKSPRWAVAYKYDSEQAETVLNDITIQVGRTGVLTPVAELQPVLLAGTKVRRATLHNQDEINKKDIRIGDHVIIEKAGEIIPIVINVITEKRPKNTKKFTFPEECPECNSTIQNTKEEVAIKCLNNECPAKIKGWVEHFASRKAMDIAGLGNSIIEQLVSNNLIQTPADLYKLNYEDIYNLDRTAEKSVNNLLNSISNSKNRSFSKILYGLGIHHVGISSANTLSKSFSNIDSLMSAKIEQLEILDDIGPVVAKSIINYFSNPIIIKMINDFRKSGLNLDNSQEEESNILEGLSFVLTGSLEKMTRDEAREHIISNNGKFSSSISKNTSYLIVGKSAGSKLDKAKDLGIPIINEEEFIKLTQN